MERTFSFIFKHLLGMSDREIGMTEKSDESRWDALFHEAVILAAEEDGNEILEEYKEVCGSPLSEERRTQYERKVGEFYGSGDSVRKSALKRRAVIFASYAAAVFLLCLPFSFSVPGDTGNGQSEQNEEKTVSGVFDHVFVYAEEKI